ncbi:sugar phosphate isomerase/epimerase family protein [Dictyobacter arantiisoli]|uniref:Xylose isomerase n=1 Tax=Dictyobacter arantiisoli TaxID=2014874 RepID=A0A5A5TAN3_9CHLR|nr:sugar phosphate isomerase/epimerase family protein [Dictyobacter arantiisoli]GCF08417.1 xylose isomerase [Dictyobacter arantiisoli]
MTAFTNLDRLSLNQATTQHWSVREAIEGCVRAGIPWIGLWRAQVAQTGLAESARIVRDTGIQVSSLCRGGWFPAATAAERQQRIDDNRRAITEAAELHTKVLVLVCGPAPDKDIQAARGMVEDALNILLPFAQQYGISLAIEPLHPMYAADRSVITSLSEANTLVEKFAHPYLGVMIDAFHVWWDADIYEQIKRASGHILGFHVSDWLVPLPDILNGRGMMGDGVIELRKLRTAVDAAAYRGPIEVEIFNPTIWDMPGDQLLELMGRRYLAHV